MQERHNMGFVKKVGKALGLKKIRDKHRHNLMFAKKYHFEGVKKDSETLVYILAGYKEILWDVVFKRLKAFAPIDADIVILSSGKYDERLSKIAKDNNWCYLSTKKNNVSLIQNTVLLAFDKAKYVYKLDEDIFLTEGFFETLKKTYFDCLEKGKYIPGIVTPLLTVNGYAHYYLLERFNLLDKYESLFEKPKVAAGVTRMIEANPDAAKFMWGADGSFKKIDETNAILKKDPFRYEACPVRFSIGAIFFLKETWVDMNYFPVGKKNAMGLDEEAVCAYCIIKSRPIVTSYNCLVGHLSFGAQNKPMEQYFKEHKEMFDL